MPYDWCPGSALQTSLMMRCSLLLLKNGAGGSLKNPTLLIVDGESGLTLELPRSILGTLGMAGADCV